MLHEHAKAGKGKIEMLGMRESHDDHHDDYNHHHGRLGGGGSMKDFHHQVSHIIGY